MKKNLLLFIALLASSIYSNAQLAPHIKLNKQLIGTSGNLLSVSDGTCNLLDVNQALNTVVFIHRNDGTVFPNSNTGNYRFDISHNLGTTWTLNKGPVNNTALLNTGYCNARFPQCAIYNPSGNSIADSAYLVYSGSWHNDAGSNTNWWKGQIRGRGKLSGDTSTFNVHADTVNNGIIGTFASLCQSSPGVFWNISTSTNATFATNSNQIINGLVVMKGVWNNTTKDVVWATQNLNTTFQTENIGYVESVAFSPVIAFDPTGNYGWAACLGSIVGNTDSVLSPIFWKTINGGTTWTGPYSVRLDSLPFVTATVGGTKSTSAFEAKLAVDYLGNPHLLTTVGTSISGYSISPGYEIFDITYNAATCVPSTNGWSAVDVATCQTLRGTYTTDGTTEDNRPLISRSADGTRLFFYWLDSDPNLTGTNNSYPNLYSQAYDLKHYTQTAVVNLTLGDSLFGGTTATTSGGLFSIGANYPTVSATALQSGSNYTVPLVLTQMDYTEYPDGGGIGASGQPAAYWYVNNLTYTPADFIISNGAGLTLIGADTIIQSQGAPYTDPGATLTYFDTACYHTGTLHVVTDASQVNINGFGYYTVYFYAEDANGNVYATTSRTVGVFPTGSNPPDAITGTTTSITSTTATLNGIINSYGTATGGLFQYGTSASYGSTTAMSPATVTANGVAVTGAVTGLTPNTLYHYRLYAQSNNGSTYGADSTFITLGNNSNICTPAVGDTGIIGPDASLVYCITEGQSFSQTYTISVPTTVNFGGTIVNVISCTIDSVENLPAGLNWSPNQSPATYSGGTTGCFLLSGTTTAPCGQYFMRIVVTLNIGFPITVSTDLFNGEREYLRVIAAGNNCPVLDRSQTVAYVPYGTCVSTGISLITSSTPATCYGHNNGTASVTASGGTTYTYAWSNGGSTQVITGLTSGNYNVTVTSNGSTATATVFVSQPGSAVGVSMSSTQSSCSSGTGTATASAFGGTPGYTYLWSSHATSSAITGLTAANYQVTVNDANSCSATGTVSVTNPPSFTLQTSSSNVSCYNGSNGTATATATNGSGPYTYLWTTTATTSTISNLATGNYSVTVKDGNGCSQFGSVTITQPLTALTVSAVSTPTSCGGSTGSVSASVSGNTSSISYVWSNGASTASVSNLQQGPYTVTASSGGCSATASVNVNSSAVYTVTPDSVNVICYGAGTGSAGVLVNGATGNVTYTWNTGSSSSTINNLVAGQYSVTVTDGSGCSKTVVIHVVQPAVALTVATSSTSSSCGNSTGSVSASVSGNTGSITYVWSNSSSSPAQNSLSQGIYTVTVTSGGCTATSSAIVNNSNGPSVTALQTDLTCFNSHDGSATVVVSGGTSPYSYNWSNTSTLSSISGLNAGSYTVIVTDASSCQATKNVTITQPDAITFNPTVANVNCHGDNTGSIALSVLGGTSPYGYSWANGGASSSTNNVLAGSYAVTVTDSKGCSATSSIQVTQPNTALAVTCSSTPSNGSTGTATGLPTGGTTPYTYIWSNGQFTSTITGLATGAYSVTVVDGKNCSVTSTVTVFETGINQVNNVISNVSLFPNPANDVVHVVVELNSPQALQFNVFDITGRLIDTHTEASANSINYELDVKALASGVYVMEITAGENAVRKRFVITR